MPRPARPRLLVTGGAGYLGRRLVAMGQGWDVHAIWHQQAPAPDAPGTWWQLDLTDAAATARLLAQLRPAAVVHTACSNRTPAHTAAIVPAAAALAGAARSVGARLVHVSSDLVLDGTAAPYDETAPACPGSPYGQAKATAEAMVAAADPGAVIVRTSLIYGRTPLDHQTRWLVDGLARGDRITLFTDEIRCPIWVDTLAAALAELAGNTVTGVLNVAGPEAVDRWSLGLAMLRWLDLPVSANVVPGTIARSGLVRPANLTLDVSRAQRLLRTPLLGLSAVVGGSPPPSGSRGPELGAAGRQGRRGAGTCAPTRDSPPPTAAA